jgi:hypothetical protein
MAKKLIIFAHGIGDSAEGFENAWKAVVEKEIDLTGVTVKGLLWEDLLQKAADQYDFGSGPLAEIFDLCDFPQLKEWTDADGWKTFKDYMMDLLIYVGLADMWLLIQDECVQKIEKLRQDGTGTEFALEDTILIGHSLGAAMLPHLVWRDYIKNGAMPYRGLILLASPLAFESPNAKICKDFLQRMAEMGEMPEDRGHVLARFARAWRKVGKDRLKFISNENDIVCSDVRYKIPGSGQLVDLIPLRQGFDPNETNIINTESEGCVQWVSFGKRDPASIVKNHDAITYLKQEAFIEALKGML